MRSGLLRRALALAAIWLAVITSVYSQHPATLPFAREEREQKAVSYTFVSPNTRANLTLAEAIKLLNSREELKLINQIQRLSSCLRLKASVMKAIGSSTDGAEHSALFRVFADRPTLRYADARLGKFARQKTVLIFRQDDAGAARMYILRARLGKLTLRSVSNTLDRNGIPFRTLVPGSGRRIFIYVVDLNHELPHEVIRAARNLGAVIRTIKGAGEFLGDDTDRDKAQQVFAGVIRRFEDEKPDIARRCAH
jgi:hypothetical protein